MSIVHATLVWPNRASNTNGTDKPMDYFWVQCTVKEAEDKIVPRLSEEFLRHYRQIDREADLDYPDMVGKRFFLISRDGKHIEPCDWYFPFAGQWNSWNPFHCMRKRLIHDVKDLRNLAIELIDCDLWEKSEAE